MYADLAIFNFHLGTMLKMISISYQSKADPLMFNIYNLIICIVKIIVLPTLLSIPNVLIALIALGTLMLSPFFYSATILSMIMINAILTKILSDKNTMKDQAKYSFLSKMGGLVGIVLIPQFLAFKSIVGHQINIFLSIMLGISFIFSLFNKLLDCKEASHSTVKKSRMYILSNAGRFKDVIFIYMVLGFLGFFQSNITFLTGSHYKALMPCFALCCLSFKKNKILYQLTFIGFAVVSYYFLNSIGLFLFSFCTNFATIESKTYAREKYGDAMEPHITSHLINDILWCMIHIGSIIYLSIR